MPEWQADEEVQTEGDAVEVIDVSAYEPCRIPSKKWRELIKKVWEADPLRCPKGSRENAHRFAHRRLRSCISSPNHGILSSMGDSNPKNTQKKKAQQSAKKVSGQKKPVAPSVPASGKRK